jgi:methylmalonyl-CoA mutase
VLGNAVPGWGIHQEHPHPEPVDCNRAILEDVEHGVTSIQVQLDAAACAGVGADASESAGLCGQDGVMVFSLGHLDLVLHDVRLDIAPISLDAGRAFLPGAALPAALSERRGLDAACVTCAFNADLLGALMRDGRLGVPVASALAQMADLPAWAAAHHLRATAVEVGPCPPAWCRRPACIREGRVGRRQHPAWDMDPQPLIRRTDANLRRPRALR